MCSQEMAVNIKIVTIDISRIHRLCVVKFEKDPGIIVGSHMNCGIAIGVAYRQITLASVEINQLTLRHHGQ